MKIIQVESAGRNCHTTWLRQEVLWLLGTVFRSDTQFGQFPKLRYLLQTLLEASKIPVPPSCYPEPSWMALIPQKNKTAKALSNSFTVFKVYRQISSRTSLKKQNTYRKPTDACINQVTVFSSECHSWYNHGVFCRPAELHQTEGQGKHSKS